MCFTQADENMIYKCMFLLGCFFCQMIILILTHLQLDLPFLRKSQVLSTIQGTRIRFKYNSKKHKENKNGNKTTKEKPHQTGNSIVVKNMVISDVAAVPCCVKQTVKNKLCPRISPKNS